MIECITVLVQPIYGYGSKVPAGFSTAQGLRDTFFVQDPLCDINEVGCAALTLLNSLLNACSNEMIMDCFHRTKLPMKVVCAGPFTDSGTAFAQVSCGGGHTAPLACD